jgi:cytochrome c peroxidase
MIKYNYLLILIVMLGITFSCGDDSITNPPEEIEQDITKYELLYGALPDPNLPADNELTKQGVALGRMLFYENMLSRDGSQNCASCHRQEHAFSDTTRFSLGVEMLPGKDKRCLYLTWHGIAMNFSGMEEHTCLEIKLYYLYRMS